MDTKSGKVYQVYQNVASELWFVMFFFSTSNMALFKITQVHCHVESFLEHCKMHTCHLNQVVYG